MERPGPDSGDCTGLLQQKDPDDGLDEPGEPGDQHPGEDDLLLQPQPPDALEKGRDEREPAAYCLCQRGLRSRYAADRGDQGRPGLPYRSGELLF